MIHLEFSMSLKKLFKTGPPKIRLLILFILLFAAAPVISSEVVSAQPDRDASQADQDFNILPDLILEKIEVKGNEKTETDLVLKILRLKPGQILTSFDLYLARAVSKNTGFIRNLKFKLKKGSARNKIILEVEVIERNSIVIEKFFLGMDRRIKPFGGFSVSEMNLLGQGGKLGLSFGAGQNQQGYRLKYNSPTFLNESFFYSLEFLYNDAREVELSGGDQLELKIEDELRYKRLGGEIEIGFSLGNFYYLLFGYHLETLNGKFLWQRPGIVTPGNNLPFIMDEDSLLSFIYFQFVRDTTNSAVFPTDGSRASLIFATSDKLFKSDYTFTKQTIDWDYYKETIRRQRIHFRINTGLIQGASPFFMKFFRGDYAYFSIGKHSMPRFLEINFTEVDEKIRYDKLLISMGADYAFPIVLNWFGHNNGYFYGAVDATHSGSTEDVFVFPLSFDLGIKFDTSIGLLNFSASYLLDSLL